MKTPINRPAVASFALLCFCSISGCVDSKNPLSDPEKADIHDGIVGVWIWEGSGVEDDEWTITPAGTGFPMGMLRITLTQSGKPETLFAFSTKLDGHHYLNVVNFRNEVVPKKWDKQLVESYTLMPYSISEDTFTGRLMDNDFISKAIHAKKVAGRFPATALDAEFLDLDLADGIAADGNSQDSIEEMQLTASTQKLRAFFSKERAKLLRSDAQKGRRKAAAKKEGAKS